jgi:hypothetical protein
MKRLREIEPRSPLHHKVQSLLDAAEPLPESRERMLRIRRALDAPRAGGVRRLPALAMALLVGLFGASAFAAVRIFEAIEQPAVEPVPAAAARTPQAPRSRHRAARGAEPSAPPAEIAAPAQAIAPAAPAVEPVAPPARSAATPPSVAQSHPRSAPRTARTASSGRSAAALRGGASSRAEPELAEPEPPQPEPRAASAGDSELVHRAVKALRRDRDPALAARLLDQHRARSPAGPLAEEALSLQIEAAIALRTPRARALAREYLARYPDGRYVAVAQRALAEDAAP